MRLLISLASLLGGCAFFTNPYDNMNAEQIAQMVKDKNLTMFCLVANSPYGRGIGNALNLDKAVLPENSTIAIDNECKITITTGQKAQR